MNVVLWVLAAVLAALFLVSGGMKIVRSKDRLAAAGQDWVESFSPGMVTLIGALEVAAAAGLILPPVTGIAPVLAPAAAIGLVLVMIGAVVVHGRRREIPNVAVNIVLAILAAVVAWGRLGPYPF